MFGKTRPTRFVYTIGLLGLTGIAFCRPVSAQESTANPQNTTNAQNAEDQRFWKLYKEIHPNATTIDPKYNGLSPEKKLFLLAHEPQQPGETVSKETAKTRFEELYKKYYSKHKAAALKAEKKFEKLYAKEQAKKHALGTSTGVQLGKKHHKKP